MHLDMSSKSRHVRWRKSTDLPPSKTNQGATTPRSEFRFSEAVADAESPAPDQHRPNGCLALFGTKSAPFKTFNLQLRSKKIRIYREKAIIHLNEGGRTVKRFMCCTTPKPRTRPTNKQDISAPRDFVRLSRPAVPLQGILKPSPSKRPRPTSLSWSARRSKRSAQSESLSSTIEIPDHIVV